MKTSILLVIKFSWRFDVCCIQQVAREKSEKRADAVRLDGGKKEFDSWWGYESLASIKENNALPSGGKFIYPLSSV